MKTGERDMGKKLRWNNGDKYGNRVINLNVFYTKKLFIKYSTDDTYLQP